MENYILTFVRGSGSVWVHLSTNLRIQVWFRFTEVKYYWFRLGSGSPKWNGSFGFTVRVQVRFDTLKKRSSIKFFRRKRSSNVFFFGDFHLRKTKKVFANFLRGFWRFPAKFQRFKKIVLSTSRGQGNFRGLEDSRPRPRTRTWKCVLEDSTSAWNIQKNRNHKQYQKISTSSFLILKKKSVRLGQHFPKHGSRPKCGSPKLYEWVADTSRALCRLLWLSLIHS